jgi:hypothetical protein
MYRFLILFCAVSALSNPSFAQQSGRRFTNAEKCEIYRSAYEIVSKRIKGLSDSFIDANNEFIKGGCIHYSFVCPRNSEELRFANEMTVATMNRGLASTFVPFKCPRPSQ